MSESRDYITFQDDRGNINISDEVVTVVIAGAVLEVEGVAGIYTVPGKDISELVRKNLSKGVRLQIEENSITADVSIMVEPGASISKVGEAVQDAVADSVEVATGLKVKAVNVHVCGIAFKKK